MRCLYILHVAASSKLFPISLIFVYNKHITKTSLRVTKFQRRPIICFEYLGLTTHITTLKCPAMVPGSIWLELALNQFLLPLHPARFLLRPTKSSISSLKCQEDLTVSVQLSYCGLSCHGLNRKLADSTSANSVVCRYAVTAMPGD